MAGPPQMSPEALFEEVLAEALELPDVKSTLAEPGVDAQAVVEEVRERRDAILGDVPEIADLEAAMRELEAAPPEPEPPQPPEDGPAGKARRQRKQSVEAIIGSTGRIEAEREALDARARAGAAVAHARQALAAAVAEELRSALNRRFREPRFQTRLELRGTEGLAQVVDKRLEVPTRAAAELAELLRRMKGGSVGISGPRGAGKTTLLRRFEEGRETVGTRPQRAVLVSAPVAYDSREFLVFLFAEVCRALGAEPPGVEPREEDDAAAAFHWPAAAGRMLLAALTILAPLVALAGLAGLLSAVQSELAAQAVWGIALVLACPALFLLAPRVTGFLHGGRLPPWLTLFVARLMRSVGLAFVVGGAALVIADAAGEAASGTAIRAGALLLGALAVIVAAVRILGHFEPDYYVPETGPTDPLARNATRQLEEIRYQLTFTHGWSAGIALPAGVQGGASADTSLARHPMTHPELAAELRKLLAQAAETYDVVIAIDELDKLETDQTADRFLNDLKAVFGVPGTYFLVSVSEDAMSRFERRGLRFRDVFDSTFDEIVHVGPLTLGEAQALLDKRLVGLPLIYSGLCHVLSGGLPRDLIRTARRLVEVSGNGAPDRLEAITSAMLVEDIGGKVQAVRFAARSQEPAVEPLLTNFLDWLVRFGDATCGSSELIDFCRGIDGLATVSLSAVNLEADGRTSRAKLLRMGLELAAYGYFAATVLELFRDDLTEAQIRELADGGQDEPALDALARAHAGFAVSPKTAWLGISEFRDGAPLPPVLPLSPQAIA